MLFYYHETVSSSNQPLEEIEKFYKSVGYGGGINEPDEIFLTYLENGLICSVRIVVENSILVLRGMYMKERYRGEGRGVKILDSIASALDYKSKGFDVIIMERTASSTN